MLIRILNTLRSRIWDMVFFLFSDYSKSTVGENGDSPEGSMFLPNCTRFSKGKRIVISLILFRCAKRFILPQKTKTSEKRVRSFQSQNCTAQSYKMQYLSQFFFYRSSLTIQHKILFQRLSAFDNKLVIYVGKRGGLPRRLCFLIRELFRHKKIVVKVKVF